MARLVTFAEAETPRRSDRLLLLHILHAGSMEPVGDAEAELRAWTADQIEVFRRSLRRFLRELAETGAENDRGAIVPTRTINRLTFEPVMVGNRLLLTFDAPARDALWFQTIELLRTVGLLRIRACPGCDRLFVRNGRREYCSERCQGRIYMRERRANGQD